MNLKDLGKPLDIDQIDFRIQSINKRFWSKVERTADCWEWTASKRHKGYGQFYFRGKPAKAHRVAWEIVNGPIPDGSHVLHRCDNPGCVNPAHLFLGANRDNVIDMVSKGRQGRKLSMEQASAIKEASINGLSGVDIAKAFSVTPAQVSNILTGKQWREA